MRLSELVPPPDLPVRAYGDWKRFVSVNGFAPPDDYRMLIREYGAGAFANWLFLIEPFNPSWCFMDYAEKECRAMYESQRQAPSTHPKWPIWPDPGGMLPWAVTADGDHVGWRTEGRPETWTTVFWSHDGTGSAEYDTNAVGFLVALAERSLGHPELDREDSNPLLVDAKSSFVPAEDG